MSTGVHGKGGRRPRRVSVCRIGARPGVPRCIRPTGTTTGPPLDELAVNLEEPRSARPPGGEWIEGRQAAGRGAFESAAFVCFSRGLLKRPASLLIARRKEESS